LEKGVEAMIDTTLSTPVRPRWLTAAGVALLLWNLMGVGAFVSQWMMAADQLATLPLEQREMWVSMPGWAWAAYAVAVFAGTAGAIGLLMRKGWAVPLFAVSLIAVLVQFTYPFIIADGVRTLGASALLFPLFIIAIGGLQAWLSARWRTAGWLN
jgi:hypothetical protein